MNEKPKPERKDFTKIFNLEHLVPEKVANLNPTIARHRPKSEDFLGTLTSKLDYIEKGIAKLERMVRNSIIEPAAEVRYEVIDENLEIPPEALEILHEVLTLGARKGKDKWWEMEASDHINHAFIHIEKWKAGLGEYHINHAFVRLMMSAVIQRRSKAK